MLSWWLVWSKLLCWRIFYHLGSSFLDGVGGRRRIIEGDLELGFGHDNKINQRGGLEKYDHDGAS